MYEGKVLMDNFFFSLCLEMKYIFGNSFILPWIQEKPEGIQCSTSSALLAVTVRISVAHDLL